MSAGVSQDFPKQLDGHRKTKLNQITDAERSLFWGIDIGGTQIKIGLVDSIGQTVFQASLPTNESEGPERAMDRISDLIRTHETSNPEVSTAVAIGIGAPGPMDLSAGTLVEPPQLPSWNHFAIVKEMERRTARPVSFQNDANAAAYGEFWLGSGQSDQSMLLLTLGTGVGGGIVTNGELINGTNSFAGEVGHMMIDPSPNARLCIWGGGRGQLEAYGSASAVSMLATQKLRKGAVSCLTRELAAEGSMITAKQVYQAATGGDTFALEIIDDTARWLGIGITSLVHVLDPGSVVLGGAMNFGGESCPIGRRFLQGIIQEFRQHTFESVFSGTSIKFARLGPAAGYLGAAGYARKEYKAKNRGES